MKSTYIEEAFESYLKTPITNHAILINGSWGSGKTFFWKNNLIEKCKESNFKTVYISLNGLNKIEDLKYQFLIKLVPYLNILDSKNSKLGKTILTTLSSAFAKININDILKEIDIDSKKISEYVVCFDDLERCSIPKAEVLGFINSYVEHKNLKVVILSDESKIKEDEAYRGIKEKVIGRILTYKNDLSETFPQLCKRYESIDAEFYKFLNDEQAFILGLLESYGQDNLRNISFYLEILKNLYPKIKAYKDYAHEVIMFALIMTIEFKLGNLTSNDYQDFKDYDELNSTYAVFNFSQPSGNSYFSQKEEPVQEKSTLELFYDKYLTKTIDDYFFYESVYVYILTGYLDKEKLNVELKSRYPEEIPIEILAFRKLINYRFRDLTTEEFNGLAKDVFEYAKQGKYTLYDYMQLSSFYNYFSTSKLVKLTIAEIQSGLAQGIGIAKQHTESNNHLYETILRFPKENDDEVIKELIIKTHKSLEEAKESEKTNKLIDAISENNSDLIENIFKEYSINKELFQYLSSEEMFNALISVENKTLTELIIQMEDRYKSQNIKTYLTDDYKFLNELSTKLKDHLNGKTEFNLNEFLLNELNEKIEMICQKIK